MTKYDEFIQLKRSQFGSKFDSSDLNLAFVPAFNSQDRITVLFQYGESTEVKRGRIGVTTGWKPVFLLMLTKRSMGSSYTIGRNARIIS
jgi:hypothetical protein